MNKLKPIEYASQRVLMTAQLAESFETEERRVSENFSRNKDRYKEGKHYFLLQGEELNDFKGTNTQIAYTLKFTSSLYLWTEKGAWLHAKSLNTDNAWEAYEALVDDYYDKSEHNKTFTQPSSIEDLIIMQAQSMKDVKAQVEMLQIEIKDSREVVTNIKETFLQRDDDWRVWVKKMLNAAAKASGDYHGMRSKSYVILTDRARCDLDKRLRFLKARLQESGATKTQINDANKLDCIENEPRLKEIYSTVVKELSIGSL